jgi:hypothetical protein
MMGALDRSISRERIGRMLLGLAVLAGTGLGYFHHPAWFLALLGISINMIQSSITDRCFTGTILARMGIPGERDMGRFEARMTGLEEKGG